MKQPKPKKLCLLAASCLLLCFQCFSQTSWRGTTSTSWATASNWSNGVPTATVDAVIGDQVMTRQPSITASATCKSLTIGGAFAATLTDNKNLTISGSLVINSNGIFKPGKNTSVSVLGNWTNSGTFTPNNSSSVIFSGTGNQTINGTTTFRKMTVNTGSTVLLNANIAMTNPITVNGTFNPNESATYTVTGNQPITVGVAGVLKVNASTLAGNYSTSTLTLNAGSTVEYSSTTVTQTVSSTPTYSTLKISGSGIKQLAANLPALKSTASNTGNIYITSGIFDLSTWTATRGTTVAGGTISVSNGATIKIGGGNTFPINYASVSLSLTSNTEYNGTTQNVTALTYGNLTLSSSSGAVAKTGPGTAFTIAGNFTTGIGAGTGVTFNAASNITISGNDTIGTATTFNGGSFTHAVSGNWVNNGTYTQGTSTINMNGPGTTIAGSAAQTFYNLGVNASNITSSAATMTISGNLFTTLSGTFTHNTSGTLTMSGTSKTISGTGISLDNLSVSGTVTTASTLTTRGNLTVAGSFTASAGNITMSGTSKTISGAGTIGFYGLLLPGTITTASNFSVSSALDVSGSFSASAGTATFTGSATLNGTANLCNVILNGTTLTLSTNSILGIASAFTITAGTLNVTSAIPNTVTYNGSGAQTVTATTYHRLTLTNGGTKTAGGAISTNGTFTIDPSTTFSASSYTHTLYASMVNNGTFTAGTSTMTFSGTANASITGATTFNILTINKSSSANIVTLASNVSVSTATMTLGQIKTGSNTLTITTTRTGSGIIMGNIQRTHTFTTGTAYAFESPDNSITFASVSGVSTITVAVSQTTISDFPYGSAINREYTLNIPSGTYNATLRLHYEDAELNGNTESALVLWDYSGGSWVNAGQSSLSSTSNYVEQSALTSINNRWTCSNIPAVFLWNGSTSTAWNTAGNWTLIQGAGTVPGANDVVQIGQGAITNQPTISTAVNVKNIQFGSVAAGTITLASGGSLTTAGNISGSWSANATHTISAGAQNLTVNGSLILSDGTSGHAINLSASTGTVSIGGSLTESGGANITLSGATAFHIGGDFTYTSGTFSAGSSSTVYYDGANAQAIAAVTYNNLTSDKSTGISTISGATTINGNLTVNNGETDVYGPTTVSGNLSVNSTAKLRSNSTTISLGGSLSNSGTFIPGSGTISFIGSGSQTISLATFNNIIINKPSGSITFTGSIDVYGDLSILSGSIDLGNYSAHRTSQGGTFTLAAGASLTIGSASNFPSNYSTNVLDAASTVIYNGIAAQTVNAVSYGNLTLTNGGSNAKTLAGTAAVNGDLTINSGATFASDVYSINLGGNWINSGTFVPTTGAVLLNGTNKTITGNTTFYKVTVYGSYSVAGSDITYNGWLNVTSSGSYAGGSGVASLYGDLTNSGSLTSTGTTTFMGTSVQTIRLLNAITSTSTGVINFNGTVSPVLNSTSTPTFATLNINNTGGINPSVDWTVLVAFNVGSGASFNAGSTSQNFYGSFVNNGTVTSSGTFNFLPSTSKTYTLAGTGFSSTGTVIFGGSGAIATIGTPGTLTNVMISNSSGVTPGSGWTMAGNFTITSNGIFNAGSYSYSVVGDLSSSGTLNGGTSNFTMSGTTPNEISGSPATTFYDYIVTGSILANSDFNVAHNFTNNNAFDATVGNPIFTGSAAGTITSSAATHTLAQFAVAKNPGSTVTLAKNIDGISSVDISGGTLDISSFSLTQDAVNGGALNVYDNAILKIGGTSNALPAFTTYTLDSLSTVEYAGTTQTVTSVSSLVIAYGNLTISAAGTKTANGTLNIRNNFTLTNGTFVAGSNIDTLGGNWSMASGAFTSTGSTLTLNGGDVQDISSTGAFNNMIVNKGSGNTTLSSSITVNGTLTFTSGLIQTGTNTLAMGTGATVSGAAQGTGWVNGKLQKNFAAGSNVSRILEVGGSTYYTPATVLIASVSTAGNLTGSATVTDHPNIATSGLNSAKSVNRYWSFANSGIVFTNASVTVNWVASDLDAGVTTSNFKVGSYSAAAWTLPTVASPLATSIQATGIIAFGDIAVGEVFTTASWTGNVSNNWATAGNWSTGSVPTGSTSVTLATGISTYPVLSSGTMQANNITIQSGATLTVSGAILQISGTITNSGTFTVSNGTLEFTGNTAQSIAGSMFFGKTIQNLTISNTAGLNVSSTANDTLIITGALIFGNVNNATLTTGGNITLRSNASGTARVGDVTNAGVNSGNTISGDVIVERYIPANATRAWRLLSVPTSGQTIHQAWQENQTAGATTPAGYGTQVTSSSPTWSADGFDLRSNTNGLLTYVPAVANGGYYTGVSSTGNSIATLSGYMLFLRGDRTALPSNGTITATTLRTKGSLYQGTTSAITVPNDQYALIGNPYASQTDLTQLTRGSDIQDIYYIWDPLLTGNRGLGGFQTFTSNGAGSYNVTPGSGSYPSGSGPYKTIESGQAFFVHSTGNTTNTIRFTEPAKTTGSRMVFRSTILQEQIATNLYVGSGAGRSLADGILNVYNNTYSNNVDNEDALKLSNFNLNLGIARNNKRLAVEKRMLIASTDTIFLDLTGVSQQQYQFEFTTSALNHPGLLGKLVDNYLGVDSVINLDGITTVNFSVTAAQSSSSPSRFMIVFYTPSPLPVTFKGIKAYQQNTAVVVEWKVANQVNIRKYETERSADGINFTKVATQQAAGFNGSDVTYNWLDQDPVIGDNFYRVRSIGSGGEIKYSTIVKVNIKKETPSVTVYPNPVVGSTMHLQFTDMEKGQYQLRLISVTGQVLFMKRVDHAGGSATKTVEIGHMATGNYRLEVLMSGNVRTVKELIISNKQ